MFDRMMTSRFAWAPEDGGAGGGPGVNTGSNTGSGSPAGTDAGGGVQTAAGVANPAAGTPAASNPGAEFLAAIPEDIRGDASLRDIRDVGNLARSFVNQGKLLGVPREQLLRLPGPDDAAGWGDVFTRLGRPEAADKYQLADPEKLPDGLTINPEAKTAFAAKAHELGLSQKQAAAFFEFVNSGRIAGFQQALSAHQEGIKAAETTLRTDWGQAYDEKHQRANEAVTLLDNHLGLGGTLETAIAAMPAESRVALGKVMEYARGFFQEGGMPGKGAAAAGGALSPAEARQQIGALQQDAQFMKAYSTRSAPGHAEAVQRMLALHEFLTPPKEAA